MELLETIAYEHGLDLIETTSDGNGYPRDLKYAVIGFETFDEAQELADRYGLTVREFKKKDGWQLWVRGGRTWGEYDYEQVMSEGYINENVKTYRHTDAESVMSDLREQLQYASLCDMKTLIENAEEVLEKLDDCQPDEFIVTCCGEYDATYLRKTMCYSYDSSCYAIGIAE
jgi:hypothetical protein